MKLTVFRAYHLVLAGVLLLALPVGVYAQQTTIGSLDEAISGAAAYLLQLDAMPEGSGIAFTGFEADALSNYTVRRLENGLRGPFTIVEIESQYLDLLEQEIALADAEAVRLESQQRYGQWEGVHFFIVGSIKMEGDAYLLHIRVLRTEGRVWVGAFEAYIDKNDRQLQSLLPDVPYSLRVSLGARVGGSLQFWTLSNDMTGEAENPALGFEPALQAAFHFNDTWAVQAEIALSYDKVSYSGNEGGSAYSASFESFSLRLPLLARFTFFITDSFSVAALAGISFNIPLGAMKTQSDLHGGGSYRFSSPMGYVIGVNGGLRIGPGKLAADIRFSGDFAKTVIHDNTGTLAVYFRNTVSLSLGYEFDLPPITFNRK